MASGRPIPPSRAAAKEEHFVEGDFVVYPTHGVGKVEKINFEEIAGHRLELIHITFEENRMTLRVPVPKARSAGLRKLATRKMFDEALAVLKGRARIKRTMWSRRAQEYEAKINSGDLTSIAEVVRDLFRPDDAPEQSYSERQIFEAASSRLARELHDRGPKPLEGHWIQWHRPRGELLRGRDRDRQQLPDGATANLLDVPLERGLLIVGGDPRPTNDREREFSPMTLYLMHRQLRRPLALACLIALPMLACTDTLLNVTDPDIVQGANSASAATGLLNGAVLRLAQAVSPAAQGGEAAVPANHAEAIEFLGHLAGYLEGPVEKTSDQNMRKKFEAAVLARDIHVLPEFLGNRSPFADPYSRAVVAGLDLDVDIGSMERLFVAGLCGLAYGLADVVDAFRSHGVDSDMMVISGGAGRSPLVRQIMADTTGLTVAVPETQEPVLLGAAMLGAVAAKSCGSIGEAMASMSAIGRLSELTPPGLTDFHRTKRRVHGMMRKLERDSRNAMQGSASITGPDTKN